MITSKADGVAVLLVSGSGGSLSYLVNAARAHPQLRIEEDRAPGVVQTKCLAAVISILR